MKEEKNKERGEDSTQYGEFISSFFSWMSPQEQQKKVKKLEKVTKKEENEKK